MTGYIYNIESRKVVATLTSNSQALIERTADRLADTETQGLTYSPAFGSNDGLVDCQAPEFDLDNGAAPESL
jgi:hypothetical protein